MSAPAPPRTTAPGTASVGEPARGPADGPTPRPTSGTTTGTTTRSLPRPDGAGVPVRHVRAFFDAFTTMAGAADEEGALEQALDIARLVTGAFLGGAVLVDDEATTHLVLAGTGAAEVARVPGPRRVVGLLGLVLDGQVVRVADVSVLPHAAGRTTPDAAPHPAAAAFLGVPVTGADDAVLGALTLSKRPGDAPFDEGDQTLVTALARQCGAVLVRLRALRRVEQLAGRLVAAEGVRAAAVQRMTAGLDPVEAVDGLLEMAREQLGMPLAAVIRVHHDGRQEVERVSGTLPAPSQPVPGTVLPGVSFCRRVVEGGLRVVPDVARRPDLARESAAWPGVAAYVGAPVVVRGVVRGTLCVVSDRPTDLSGADVSVLEVLADFVGRQLARRDAASLLRTRREEQVAPFLAPGGLDVVLQPVVALRHGAVIGVEALARPTGFPGGPADLFAEATRLGVGVDLELVAVDAALALLPGLPPEVQMGVNVGPATACDPRLLERVAAAVGDREHRVVVELTEHEDVSGHPQLARRLADLRAVGALVAIDDAGAGYAGLRSIVDLAPDVLKLDISLVSGIDRDPARRALVSTLVALARELGAYLVAEGVERPGELAVLRRLEVSAAQGFYLARPVPHDRLDLRPRAVAAVPRPATSR